MSDPATTRLPAAFRRLGWSNFIAQFAEQIALAASPLVAVLVLAAGPVETGWLQAAQTLPFLLLSIPAGLLADRWSRPLLMVGAETVRATSLVLTLTLLGAGMLNLPVLALLGLLGATGTVCYSVAAPALVPSLVPRTRLGDANRWLELARSAAYTGGPAVGGSLVGWIGASPAFALATMLSALAVLFLAGIGEPPRVARPDRKLLRDLSEGMAFVASHVLLRPILVTAVVFNVSWFVLQAVFVAYAVQNLGMDATTVGAILGVYGVGMVAGALVAPMIARHLNFGTLIVIGPLAGACAALLLALTIWLPAGPLAGLSFFLFGAGPILWTITTTTLRQAVTPDAMLGRVSALLMTATFGARPLGAALGGFVAAGFGVNACLIVAATGFVLQLVLICASAVPGLRQLPDAV